MLSPSVREQQIRAVGELWFRVDDEARVTPPASLTADCLSRRGYP